MYIYGLDLSMANTGVTIIDEDTYEVVYISSIGTNKKQFKGLPETETFSVRLAHHFKEINKLIAEYPPSVAVIERGFTRFNNATQVLFRVHGIYNLAFAEVPNVYYPPKKIKEIIYRGTADKSELAQVIQNSLDVQFKNEDESDSCAVALTYLIENGMPWVKSKVYTKKDLEKLTKPLSGKKAKKSVPKKKVNKNKKDDIDVDLEFRFAQLEE